MNRQTSIEQLLADLGPTVADVADAFRKANIHGVRNTVRYLNPVVRYVQETLRVDDYMLDIWTSAGSPDVLRVNAPSGGHFEITLPKVVKDFLVEFNRGAYPDLELPPTQPPGP